jgi:hypothetical protein
MYLFPLYLRYASSCFFPFPMPIFDRGNDWGSIERARKKTRRAKYYRRHR